MLTVSCKIRLLTVISIVFNEFLNELDSLIQNVTLLGSSIFKITKQDFLGSFIYEGSSKSSAQVKRWNYEDSLEGP